MFDLLAQTAVRTETHICQRQARSLGWGSGRVLMPPKRLSCRGGLMIPSPVLAGAVLRGETSSKRSEKGWDDKIISSQTRFGEHWFEHQFICDLGKGSCSWRPRQGSASPVLTLSFSSGWPRYLVTYFSMCSLYLCLASLFLSSRQGIFFWHRKQ